MENPNSGADKSVSDQPAEATSAKTLSDLEEEEKVPSASKANDTAPSPDGQFDENAEKERAGPM
ncbi:MAG TPA: hypothetical protein VN643_26310 [Pyrinomonadaceae bacterium]|nr:hypothetical protein [Pyrinomonadaceae bacterium]